jgi:hypothetical protein
MIIFFKRKQRGGAKNFEEALKLCQKLEQDFNKLVQEFESFKKESSFFLQKIGIVRFNPFKEIGGDQSFSIALLDGKDSGIVLTSLYSPQGNRIYAKPIEQGKSKYHLSEEEKKAIERAKACKSEILISKS